MSREVLMLVDALARARRTSTKTWYLPRSKRPRFGHQETLPRRDADIRVAHRP